MNLNNKEWKEFFIKDLFDVSGTTTTHPSKLIKGGKVPRVTCSSINNGLDDVYLNTASEKGGVLTVDSATIGYISYQEVDFIATDHVEKIFLKNKKINRNLGLGLRTCIKSAILNKFNYGYKFSQERIRKQKIILPINDKDKPDYEYMEEYTKSSIDKKINSYKKYAKSILDSLECKEISKLHEKEWGEFFIDEIAYIKPGKRLTKADMIKGNKPFIGSSDSNNGITEFTSNTNQSEDFNVLGVNYNGSVVENFYHPYKAIFSDDVKRLSLKDVEGNKYLYLFIKNSILKQKSKYQYAYKFNEKRLKRQKILLPVNETNKPDYKYMEQYMKNLEYKKIKQYLDYLEVIK